MPHHRTLVLCLALAVLLAGCTRIPTTLSPVPEALPDEASAYPPDAIHAMRGIIGHLQGETLRGTRFTPEAHHALATHGFHYSGFRVTHHRLLRYAARADGPTGRTTSGAATLSDSNGRRAGIVYSSIYTVDENGVNIDMAQVTPIYTRTPVIRVFLVPKDGLPAPAATWTETYKTMRRLDSMPEGGLENARPLDTHALAVFVLDRTAPDVDVQLSLDIPELKRILPIVRLKSDDYRDYDGWRVAIVRVNPAMQAGL